MKLSNAQHFRFLLNGRLPARPTPLEEARAILAGLGWSEEAAARKLWVQKSHLRKFIRGKISSRLLLRRILELKETAA